jgi:hypothetical protein
MVYFGLNGEILACLDLVCLNLTLIVLVVLVVDFLPSLVG